MHGLFFNYKKKVAHAGQIKTYSGFNLLLTPSENHCVNLRITSS